MIEVKQWLIQNEANLTFLVLLVVLLVSLILQNRQNRNPHGSSPAPLHHQHPTEEEHRTNQQSYWDQQLKAQRRPNWIGGFTVAFSAIAACATVFAYLETRRQANIAQSALNEVRAGSTDTKNAVNAAERSAAASTRQAEISRDTEIQELRPYIAFLRIEVPRIAPDGKEVIIGRRLINRGRSVAFDIQRTMQTQVLPWPLPGGGNDLVYPNDLQVVTGEQIGFLTPGEERNTISRSVNPDDVDSWYYITNFHAGYVFVEYGTIRYKDVFGGVHHFWFCDVWDGHASTTRICPRGNRMD